MSLISLRESLARSKAKWKKRLHVDPKNANPIPSIPGGSAGSVSTAPNASGLLPTTGNSQNSSPSTNLQTPISQTNLTPESGNKVWTGAKNLLTALESSSSVHIVTLGSVHLPSGKRAAYGRKDYEELKVKIDGLLADLAQHVAQPMDPMMTNSVKLLCSKIQAELKGMEDNKGQKLGKRLVDAMDSQDEVLECYRRINDYIERLTLNANLSILNANWSIQKAINEQTTERNHD
ncbi:unnamed protein product [Rhizoctonia solani]|uniref:Uncharacterized protein n=1 Tax=Rhizoctonia solani TaxID=456999 RepID=A0A8H2XV43_9AGAM|nr:unnamed protein product [Rhizoctonia solani]